MDNHQPECTGTTVLPRGPHTLTTSAWLAHSSPHKLQKMTIISRQEDNKLANQIFLQFGALESGIPKSAFPTIVKSDTFSNGEAYISIDTNVRDRHVVIVWRCRTGSINDDFMRLLLTLDACSRSGAKHMSVLLPYFPYSRSDKKDSGRCPIGAAMIARLLTSAGVGNIICADLHAGQIQGFCDRGFHNLYALNYICNLITRFYLDGAETDDPNDRYILVAPDAGSGKAIRAYSAKLNINNLILDKQRDYSKKSQVLSTRFTGSADQFRGKTGLVIDDMVDTMGTLVAASSALVEAGMRDVVVFVTHGVLSGPALQRIEECAHISAVFVSDTLPQDVNLVNCSKLIMYSLAELYARAIDGIVTGKSISRLFE